MKTNFNQTVASGSPGKRPQSCGFCSSRLLCLAAPQPPVSEPVVITLSAGVSEVQIQAALDALPVSGGEVVLPPGKFEIGKPIVLQRDFQTLRGSGGATMLRLADNANCPVIIMGEPSTIRTRRPASAGGGFFIDGNRAHQQRELWR